MHGKVGLLDFSSQEKTLPLYEFHCNASHVQVYHKGRLVYDRTPATNVWYDESHKAIVNAMEVLEKAVIAAVKA